MIDDVLHLSGDKDIVKMLGKHGSPSERVLFSAHVVKFNRKNRAQTRVLMVTDKGVYNLKSGGYSCQRRVDISQLSCLTLSETSELFVVHVPDEYDYKLACVTRDALVSAVSAAHAALTGEGLRINYTPDDSTLDQVIMTKEDRKQLSRESVRLRKINLGSVPLPKESIEDAKTYVESASPSDCASPIPNKKRSRLSLMSLGDMGKTITNRARKMSEDLGSSRRRSTSSTPTAKKETPVTPMEPVHEHRVPPVLGLQRQQSYKRKSVPASLSKADMDAKRKAAHDRIRELALSESIAMSTEEEIEAEKERKKQKFAMKSKMRKSLKAINIDQNDLRKAMIAMANEAAAREESGAPPPMPKVPQRRSKHRGTINLTPMPIPTPQLPVVDIIEKETTPVQPEDVAPAPVVPPFKPEVFVDATTSVSPVEPDLEIELEFEKETLIVPTLPLQKKSSSADAVYDPHPYDSTNVHKLDKSRVVQLDTVIKNHDAPVPPSSTHLHLNRPVHTIDPVRKETVEKLILSNPYLRNAIEERAKEKEAVEKEAMGRKRGAIVRGGTDVDSIIQGAEAKLRDAKARREHGDIPVVKESEEEEEEEESNEDKNVPQQQPEEVDEDVSFPEMEVVLDHILEDNPELTELSLNNYPVFEGIKPKSREARMLTELLTEALAFNNYYSTITLSRCGLDDYFLKLMVKWIKDGSFKALKVLNIGHNNFSHVGLVEFFEVLGRGFDDDEKQETLISKRSSTFELGLAKGSGDTENEVVTPFLLRELYIDKQSGGLNSDMYNSVVAALARNTHIVKMDLTISNDSIRKLVRNYLKRNVTMAGEEIKTVLTPLESRIKRIQANTETSSDGDAFIVDGDLAFQMLPVSWKLGLAKSIRMNTRLRTLHLTDCGLTDAFVYSLASSLIDNRRLELVDLQGNEITHKGVLALMHAVSSNSSIRHVKLSNQHTEHNFSRSEETTLVEQLQGNETLLSIDLVLLDETARRQLGAIIQRNCLSQLEQWQNGIESGDEDEDDSYFDSDDST